MDCAEFDELIARAGDRCEICRARGPETAHRRLFIDHDERLGRWAVRGLLCGTCNSNIGRGWQAPALSSYLANPWRGAADQHRAILDFRKIRYQRS
jgi:hypothetical protein